MTRGQPIQMETAKGIYWRTNSTILDRWVRPRVTDRLIEEHRSNPFGKHSPDLDIVLNFLRRESHPDKPLYVIVRNPDGSHVAATASSVRGAPVQSFGPLYPSEEEAEHAIFLQQLHDVGITATKAG